MFSTITNALLSVAKVMTDYETDDPKNKREIDLILSKGSANKFLSQYVLEPQVVISESLKGNSHIKDVETALAEIFASTTKQVFDVLLSVYGFDASFAMKMISSKDFYSKALNMESEDGVKVVVSDMMVKLQDDSLIHPFKSHNMENSKKGIERVFRQLELTAKVGKKKDEVVTIKVLVAMGVKYVSSVNIIKLIETGSDKYGFWSRVDDMMAGAVSIGNFIFARDMVRNYKKNRLKDKDEILKALEDRQRTSTMKLVTNQALGFARYYQMMVITERDREDIEKIIGGSLDKQKYRDKVLENSKSSTLVVMNDDFSLAEFYLHDFTDSITVTYKSLSTGGDKNSEILEFLLSKNY